MDTKKSLLAHIVSKFSSQENVANSRFCYLLNQYLAVRETLKTVLEIGRCQAKTAIRQRDRHNPAGRI